MHVRDARGGLVGAQQDVIEFGMPLALATDGIGGNFAQVTGGNQVVQRLRPRGLIQRVLLNGVAHGRQILLEYGLLCPKHRFFVTSPGHGDQHQDDEDHKHHLDHGESAGALASSAKHGQAICKIKIHAYQSEHFVVPSSAMLVDNEKTSKTFLPPQLEESGSSCTERMPHSAFPVMGSSGMRLRKRTCRIKSWPRFELLFCP